MAEHSYVVPPAQRKRYFTIVFLIDLSSCVRHWKNTNIANTKKSNLSDSFIKTKNNKKYLVSNKLLGGRMIVNGKNITLEQLESNSIQALLSFLKLKPETVAVEINHAIQNKDKWSDVSLKEEDKVEIIKFVGGG